LTSDTHARRTRLRLAEAIRPCAVVTATVRVSLRKLPDGRFGGMQQCSIPGADRRQRAVHVRSHLMMYSVRSVGPGTTGTGRQRGNLLGASLPIPSPHLTGGEERCGGHKPGPGSSSSSAAVGMTFSSFTSRRWSGSAGSGSNLSAACSGGLAERPAVRPAATARMSSMGNASPSRWVNQSCTPRKASGARVQWITNTRSASNANAMPGAWNATPPLIRVMVTKRSTPTARARSRPSPSNAPRVRPDPPEAGSAPPWSR